MACTTTTYAEPWYSGPLLSDPSIVTPIGHGFFQMHIYKVYNYGAYNDNFNFYSLPLATTGEIDTTLNYGITEKTEVQGFFTLMKNKTEGQQAANLGDTTITIATQLMLQNGRKWPPNVKLMYRQVFPTGRYDNLNADLYGTDATGQGSYLNVFAANMEHVSWLGGENYLVGFATVAITHANRVHLQGNSIYGGDAQTNGTIWPGDGIAFNLAAEYIPSKHWGFILEGYVLAQQASDFKGEIGQSPDRFEGRDRKRHPRLANAVFNRLGRRIVFNNLRPSVLNLGGLQEVGHGNIAEFTLAPAIDYSFTETVSLTGGVWFTVAAKNSPAFFAPMLSFTAEW
ncbi:MAG: hypothetical protein K0U37_07765 [Gammaproteobacteria bacterium]|nr:hypothetical protein [Gammaproteobacteria bacterium]